MSKKRYRTLSAYLADHPNQTRLAEQVGVSPSAISLYIKGERIPVPAVALKLAKLCRVPLETLLTRKAA